MLKKIFAIVCCLVFSLTLTACGTGFGSLKYTEAPGSDIPSGTIIAQNSKYTLKLDKENMGIILIDNATKQTWGSSPVDDSEPQYDEYGLLIEQHPKVKWVNYCGLPSSKYYTLAQKYLPKGGCGVMAFAVEGDKEDAIRFMDSLKFIAIVTHVADARSCVLNPASHTHRQLSNEQLIEAGIDPDLIRLSVGIEDAEDIIADLEQALQAF
jgi:hypothetical protein